MPRYISLINFTEQGVKKIGDWDKRIQEAREKARQRGDTLHHAYLTLGEYDAVVVFDTKDDAGALRSAMEYALGGNGRTKTLRAFTEDEAIAVTKGLG
jgi:uncharacterized protein with GYD domain